MRARDPSARKISLSAPLGFIWRLRPRGRWLAAACALWAPLAYAAAPEQASPVATTDNGTFANVLVFTIAIVIFLAFATVRSSLSRPDSKWSLADALSEEADITPLDKDGTPLLLEADGAPRKGADGKALTVSKLTASTSRFIALLGLIGILMMYLGFGFVVLEAYARTGLPPEWKDLKGISYFLLSGITMFAPYIVNKFSSVFDWLKPTN